LEESFGLGAYRTWGDTASLRDLVEGFATKKTARETRFPTGQAENLPEKLVRGFWAVFRVKDHDEKGSPF
jgi:hypothetical protein